MEATLLNAIIFIATLAALIRFALLEWEGILHAWSRVARATRRRKTIGDQRNGYR
jgi:hypothetical protein